MNTMNADELARAGVQMLQAAERMKPGQGDKFFNSKELIVYHLRMAAKLSRELSEALSKEPKG